MLTFFSFFQSHSAEALAADDSGEAGAEVPGAASRSVADVSAEDEYGAKDYTKELVERENHSGHLRREHLPGDFLATVQAGAGLSHHHRRARLPPGDHSPVQVDRLLALRRRLCRPPDQPGQAQQDHHPREYH